MRKQHIFRPNGWNELEVRITPSAGSLSAAGVVRIDAHVQLAKVHHHAHHKAHHLTPPVGGYTGSVIYVSGSGGGYTGNVTAGDGTRIVRRAAVKSAAPWPWNSPSPDGRQFPSRLTRASRGDARR